MVLSAEKVLPRFKVLVVDDENGPRQTVAYTVSEISTVHQADRASVALEKIRQELYDVVFLDVRMPEMDGITALKEIRKIDPLVGVVILTGHGTLSTAQDSLLHGANQYLSKPPNVAELFSAVRRNGEATQSRRRQAKISSDILALNGVLKGEIEANQPHVWQGRASAELVHDLNSPLSVVIGYAAMLEQLLVSGDLGDEAIKEKLLEEARVVGMAAKYCNHLSESWRAASKKTLVFELVDLVGAAKEVHDCLLLGNSMIKVVGIRELPVRGVRFEIMRVFQNLLKNATEAHATQVTVEFSVEDGSGIVRISDDGDGMSEDDVHAALHGGFSSKENGTGLGITICKHLVATHGGALRISSQLGEGTLITLSFPLPAREAAN